LLSRWNSKAPPEALNGKYPSSSVDRQAIAQQTPRGEDDQVGLGEGFSDFARLSVGLFLLEGVDQFDRGEEPDLAAVMFNVDD